MHPRQLKPWPENPRNNEGEPVRKVMASIKRFGFGAPLVVRAANLEIIAGHTRWKAAMQLKLDRVPVRALDLPESEAHLLALGDNRLGELAEWSDALPALLAAVKLPDVLVLGWTQADMDRLTASVLGATKLDDPPRLDRPGTTEEKLCPNCGYNLKLPPAA